MNVTRLPMPVGTELDASKWRVLCETTFPNAKSAEAIVLALDYCRARGLDIFRKPVHIVPMWNAALKREVETIWPGINEVQVTAARTGKWAGMDAPEWGVTEEKTFNGRRKMDGNWEDVSVTLTIPEWCSVTVYRMIEGHRCAFTEPVYWLEAYSRAGGNKSELPNDMWVKRPRGQLHKVAKAASLRAAFPEEGELTAEEMAGQETEAGGIVIDHIATPEPKPAQQKPAGKPAAAQPKPATPVEPPMNPETGEVSPHAILIASKDGKFDWIGFGKSYLAALKSSSGADECQAWYDANVANMETLAKHQPQIHARLTKAIAEQVGWTTNNIMVVDNRATAADPFPSTTTNEDII